MSDMLSGVDLVRRLTAIADTHGVKASTRENRTLTGAQEVIKSKWFLGGRKLTYRMRCDLDEPARTVRFREATAESSWGVPPPTVTVEQTVQRGTRASESRTDRGAGGGHLDYGSLRDDVEAAVRSSGWQFVFEPGRHP
jgi:hypothetical protein